MTCNDMIYHDVIWYGYDLIQEDMIWYAKCYVVKW